MNRRLASVLLAGFSVSVATGAAIALGNSVSTTPPPAFVHSTDSGSGSAGTADAAGTSSTVTSARATTVSTSSGAAATTATTGAAAPGTPTSNTTATTFDDRGSAGHDSDDPPSHDLGDDHGGSAGATSGTSTPSTTVTTFDDHGGDHDDDERRGRNRGSDD